MPQRLHTIPSLSPRWPLPRKAGRTHAASPGRTTLSAPGMEHGCGADGPTARPWGASGAWDLAGESRNWRERVICSRSCGRIQTPLPKPVGFYPPQKGPSSRGPRPGPS